MLTIIYINDDPVFGNQSFWIRPLANFLDEVTIEGHKVPRFTKIEEKMNG